MPENPTGPPFLHNTVFQADTLPPVCSRRLGRKAAKRHDAALDMLKFPWSSIRGLRSAYWGIGGTWGTVVDS